MHLSLKNIFTVMIIAAMPYAYADDVVRDVGQGVADVGQGVGQGVVDVGKGVGDAVTDVGEGVKKAVTGNGTTTKSTARPISDEDIKLRVQNKINDLDVAHAIAPGYYLNVSSDNGNVTITGVVINERDIDRVRQAALQVNGVRSVTTDIKIKDI